MSYTATTSKCLFSLLSSSFIVVYFTIVSEFFLFFKFISINKLPSILLKYDDQERYDHNLLSNTTLFAINAVAFKQQYIMLRNELVKSLYLTLLTTFSRLEKSVD